MRFEAREIPGVALVHVGPHPDVRGFFGSVTFRKARSSKER